MATAAMKNMMALRVMSRAFSTTAQRARAQAPHGDSTWKKWRAATFLAAIPVLIVGHLNAFVFVDPEEHKRPEFVPYEHMRTRTKRFPWGDGNHSLMHNPQVNALPDGYEEEEHHH